MSVYRRQGRPTWYYDFQCRGVRFCGSTGETEKGKARDVERALRVAAGQGAAGGADRRSIEGPPPLTWNQAAEKFYQEKARHEASAATTDGHLADIVRLLGPATALHDTDDAALARFAALRRAEKSKRAPREHPPSCRCEACALSPATVNRQVELIRRVMKRAARVWRVRLPDPWPAFAEHRLPEPAGRMRELTIEEEDRLFAALRPDLHAFAAFCLLTGIRKANAATLTWPQVDFAAGVIRVMAKSRRPGGQPQAVPMTAAVRALLLGERGRHATAVFTYAAQRTRGSRQPGGRRRKGQRYPLTVQGWTRAWRVALKHAGVADFRFHDLRHTTATRVLRASKNLRAVQGMLGHSSIATTARYAHVLLDDIRDAMEAAAPRPRAVPAGEAGHRAATGTDDRNPDGVPSESHVRHPAEADKAK